jgi:hypothetical protein
LQSAVKILSEHKSKHLQNQVVSIVRTDSFTNSVCLPGAVMIEKGMLSTNWNALEMPTTYIVLNK